MRYILVLSISVQLMAWELNNQIRKMEQEQLNILSLGDSYTIGEQMPIWSSFPYILNQRLRALKQFEVNAAEIVAKTGYTTDELIKEIQGYVFRSRYSFTTLLIGVNNQYRGYPIEQYSKEFEQLLNIAIGTTQDNKKVVVLSIPDWGITKFAKEKETDAAKVSSEIDQYNQVAKDICAKYQVGFIDITTSTREHGEDPEYFAADGLHYSAKEHSIWAEKVYEYFFTSK